MATADIQTRNPSAIKRASDIEDCLNEISIDLQRLGSLGHLASQSPDLDEPERNAIQAIVDQLFDMHKRAETALNEGAAYDGPKVVG